MTAEDRVKAIAEFGFTERQARFLVTVMLHAGVCVPRQYAAFAGTAYGHNVTRFFDKLVERGYATATTTTDTPTGTSGKSNRGRSNTTSRTSTSGSISPTCGSNIWSSTGAASTRTSRW